MIQWFKRNDREIKLVVIYCKWGLVLLLVFGFMGLAGYISYGDIKTLAIRYGVEARYAWTAPIFIDGLTWMGKLGRAHIFDAKTRRGGLVLMAFGGTMSLFANVWVGLTLGMRIYGALLVVGYVVAEWYSGLIRPKEVAKKKDDEEQAAEATEAATAKPVWSTAEHQKKVEKAKQFAKTNPAISIADLSRVSGASQYICKKVLDEVRKQATTDDLEEAFAGTTE